MATMDPAIVASDENSLQPFFVLHKASKPARESSRKSRRIPKSPQKSNSNSIEESSGIEPRLQSFHFLWNQIESIIEDVLKVINTDVFDNIVCWIRESFDVIRSHKLPEPTTATKMYPILLPNSFKQLYTALVYTNNMEFVDDIQTFGDLAKYLKSRGCHVANLSSLDFSAKMGVGGCIRSLLRQFLSSSTDSCDISILASWYCEQGNYEGPITVIVDGIERCCGSVLSDFIVMLSEWASKIPIVLILGVTTTTAALRDIIPSTVLNFLFPTKFILGSPVERMNRIIEAVLLKHCSCFSLGHKVVNFLRNNFLMHDGTLISFIRALKMACLQHFVFQPPNFVFTEKKEFSQDLSKENVALIQERITMKAFGLECPERKNLGVAGDEFCDQGVSELQRQCTNWASVVMCVYEAGKKQKVNLLDLYCEVLDPRIFKSRTSDVKLELEYDKSKSSNRHLLGQSDPCLEKCSCISRIICGIRDLPAGDLHPLLRVWAEGTEGLDEIHEKIKELKSLVMPISTEPTDVHKKLSTRSNTNLEKDTSLYPKRASELASCMVREHLQPIECIPLNEFICFKNVDKLQSALMGEPRTRVQVDLLDSKNGILLPSMHDTSILYSLAQEHGDLINLHDLFQSFKASLSNSSVTKTKKKLQQNKSQKKRKTDNEPQSISDASIQARFCRAIAELQITGLLRMPSKRRPDFVQRVGFGV